jgi:hypothetical protein
MTAIHGHHDDILFEMQRPTRGKFSFKAEQPKWAALKRMMAPYVFLFESQKPMKGTRLRSFLQLCRSVKLRCGSVGPHIWVTLEFKDEYGGTVRRYHWRLS